MFPLLPILGLCTYIMVVGLSGYLIISNWLSEYTNLCGQAGYQLSIEWPWVVCSSKFWSMSSCNCSSVGC